MNQEEMKTFFEWAAQHLAGFEVSDCEESDHYYLGDTRIGGWAGDRRQYFIDQNDELAKALRMFDAYHA